MRQTGPPVVCHILPSELGVKPLGCCDLLSYEIHSADTVLQQFPVVCSLSDLCPGFGLWCRLFAALDKSALLLLKVRDTEPSFLPFRLKL